LCFSLDRPQSALAPTARQIIGRPASGMNREPVKATSPRSRVLNIRPEIWKSKYFVNLKLKILDLINQLQIIKIPNMLGSKVD
tara:strand:+ start:898 stop:1146 length:249 start_codon:yes stop_codon:yes gene_type:complete